MKKLANRWKGIGKLSALGRNRNEVKNRIHFLLQSKENDDHILQEGSAAEEPEMSQMQGSDRALPEVDQNFAVMLGEFAHRSLSALEQLRRSADRAGR